MPKCGDDDGLGTSTSRAINPGTVLTGTPSAPIIVMADLGRLRRAQPRLVGGPPERIASCVKLTIPEDGGVRVAHARKVRIDGPCVIRQVTFASGATSVRLEATGEVVVED
jgi:hypothetical protein